MLCPGQWDYICVEGMEQSFVDNRRSERPVILTVGHSNHSIEAFIGLLRRAGVTAVADVRSVPFSRYAPQYNRPRLEASLRQAQIAYVFLGRELGARPDDRSCYVNGVADYSLISRTKLFQDGLRRVLDGAKRFRIALMCAEKDPLDCHRNILVARCLKPWGAELRHIMPNGRIEENADTERRLLHLCGQVQVGLFDGVASQDPLSVAYETRGREIAYSEPMTGAEG